MVSKVRRLARPSAQYHQQPGWCCELWTQTDRFGHNGFAKAFDKVITQIRELLD